jgi:hypothetical protein
MVVEKSEVMVVSDLGDLGQPNDLGIPSAILRGLVSFALEHRGITV